MKKIGLLFLLIVFFLQSCTIKKKEIAVYHQFRNHSWHRFEKLLFELPVEEIDKSYDILFFAVHTTSYEFDNLDFGVLLNTPSGEERANQYSFCLKKKFGGFVGDCNKDSCVVMTPIKRGIYFSQKGMLKIEIENMVPRIEVKNLYGVGVKIIPGK